jgi:hypothetical protein
MSVRKRGKRFEICGTARSTSPRRKTGRARDVDLIAPLAQDLAEWRMACGRPPDGELVIPRP